MGDRNVLERMLEKGYVLGGEQSGHTIFLEHCSTGDGQLSSLQFLQLLSKSGKKASELVGECKRYPQVLLNVPMGGNEQKNRVMAAEWLKEAVAAGEASLNGEGRILVRASGTEALIRVMVEAKEDSIALECANNLVKIIKEHEFSA